MTRGRWSAEGDAKNLVAPSVSLYLPRFTFRAVSVTLYLSRLSALNFRKIIKL